MQAGEVRVRNLSKDAPPWQQQLVQESVQVVLAALQQEARSRPDGFGRHILAGRGLAHALGRRQMVSASCVPRLRQLI